MKTPVPLQTPCPFPPASPTFRPFSLGLHLSLQDSALSLGPAFLPPLCPAPASLQAPLYLPQRLSFIQLPLYLLSRLHLCFPPGSGPPLLFQPLPPLSLPAVPYFCLGPGPSFLLLPVPLRSALLLHLSHLSSLIFFPSVLAPFLSLVLPLLSAPPLPQPHPFSLGVYSLDTSPSPDRFFLFTFPPLLLLCSSSAFCLALLYSFLHTAALLFWWLPSVPASSCHSLCPPGISWSSLPSPNSRPLFSGISSLL